MKLNQVAAQLYTLRAHCKTAEDFAASCAKLKRIGYGAVQISGVGPIPENELVHICANEGLVICATHEPGKTIVEEPQKVVDRLAKLGCAYTAYPSPHRPLTNAAEAIALAKDLDRAGELLRKNKQVLTYHNHAGEFRRDGGRTLLDLIYANSDPKNLQGEIDTYWVQTGGGDPVDWCARLKNRLPLLHLKDYGVESGNKGTMMEIGNGNLDWKRIIAAAEASGCKWFIVEQDECPGDPFQSLAQSWSFISDHLAERPAAMGG